MSLPRKILVYGAIAVGGLVAVSLFLSIISAIISTIVGIISAVISLAIFVLLLYGGARLILWLTGASDLGSVTDTVRRSDSSSADATETMDPAERARELYVRGEIDEAELDRRLGRYVSDGEQDEIDRELERSRN
ncbi:MAG: hypothetical protein A07HR60_00570 [uncultured archaeon A07HR60]|jgi:hypothetical protein|nr:MAG: hypothetical protein J07HR59_00933 [Halorubrum sp. J07HR59]ESS12469.1 MAG: hypothetical protein A07HR60_00570 [uncultured archaeon A07HR60]